jgi:adenine-specific DNA methylase
MVMKLVKNNFVHRIGRIQECYHCNSIVEIEKSDMQLLDRTVKNGDYYFVCPCCGAYTIPQEDENGFVIDLVEEEQNRRKKAEEQRKKAEERKRLEREANEIDNNFKIYSFIILEIIITLLVVWGIVNVYQAF